MINRAQIIDDVLNIARAGLLKYEIALEVTLYLKNEREYLPWAAALSGIEYIDEMLKGTTSYGDFKVILSDVDHYIVTFLCTIFDCNNYIFIEVHENIDRSSLSKARI